MVTDPQSLLSIDANTILQADVTIVAGILILLTISGVLEAKLHKELWQELRALIAISPLFFIVSAMLILLQPQTSFWNSDSIMIVSRWSLAVGLVYLAIDIIIVMIVSKPKITKN